MSAIKPENREEVRSICKNFIDVMVDRDLLPDLGPLTELRASIQSMEESVVERLAILSAAYDLDYKRRHANDEPNSRY